MPGTGHTEGPYRLEDQVGFLMRRATQRHLALFARQIPALTPMQFAALSKICELGQTSQNALGRATAMDAATIKGVIDRLRRKGYVASRPDPEDRRRVHLVATPEGCRAYRHLERCARIVTSDTLEPLNDTERRTFLKLLAKLV